MIGDKYKTIILNIKPGQLIGVKRPTLTGIGELGPLISKIDSDRRLTRGVSYFKPTSTTLLIVLDMIREIQIRYFLSGGTMTALALNINHPSNSVHAHLSTLTLNRNYLAAELDLPYIQTGLQNDTALADSHSHRSTHRHTSYVS
ncbi:hypothetical protein PS623_04628 [Pseudomonas fluorescens]|nr:hypothetical protein PS623_04628 [Pseudomonas fluorescens]